MRASSGKTGPFWEKTEHAPTVYRVDALLEDHRRVREAVRNVGQYSVNTCLPVDVIGV